MNIDFFTTAALADEFQQSIVGGRVQQVVQITPLSYGLEFYAHRQRRYLILSANPRAPRIHLQDHKPRRGEGKQTPLLQLFRKYLKGSILTEIEQPPYERLLTLQFAGKTYQSGVVIELIGNRSNLIFTDNKRNILALARPAPGKTKQHRTLLPGHRYRLPAGQNKRTPETLDQNSLRQVLNAANPDAAVSKVLVSALAGLSPLIAEEIVYRAYEQSGLTMAEIGNTYPLLEAIEQVYHSLLDHRWYPQIARDDEGRVTRFAPIALTHLPQAESIESISQGVAAHFSQKPEYPRDGDGYTAVRRPVRQRLDKAEVRLKRRLAQLERDAAKLASVDSFKQKGEAILAYSYQIEPGQNEITLLWTDGETLKISLDPVLSPSENAQKYFKRYRKAQRAAEIIPEQRRMIKLQQEYLNQLALDLELAETRPEIDAVGAALEEAGLARKPSSGPGAKTKKPAARPHRFTSPDGFTVWVGKNARQNHHLTFHLAAPNDIWLHARGVPGSHVIISTAQGEPPRATLLWAAGLAAHFSKAGNETEVDVSYTRKKYVRAIKGAPPGLASIRNEKTLLVEALSIINEYPQGINIIINYQNEEVN